MKLRNNGDCANRAASVSFIIRWLGTLTLATGILLLPLAGSLDHGIYTGSSAIAGNGGGSGGGNGGSGKGGGKGNGGSGPDKGDLYGDMIYVTRDVNGVPVVDTEGCMDPIAWDGESWVDLPLYHEIGDPDINDPDLLEKVDEYCLSDEYGLDSNGLRLQVRTRDKDRTKDQTGDRDRDRTRDMLRDRLRILLQLHQSTVANPGFNAYLEADDGELGACDVITLCANNTQEVDLGRLSVLRAPERVLDKSRDEVIKVLDRSMNDPVLDHSGRLVVDGATFDSPLINLSLYRDFHLFWQLQDASDPPLALFTPGSGEGIFGGDFGPFYDPYMAMAFGMAAGSDKEGWGIDIDVISRANAILYLPGNESDNFPETLGRQIEGKWQYFINYSDFTYTRSNVFPGCIWFDDVANWLQDQHDTIMHAVFNDEDVTASNIAGFALAADDARRVLAHVHDLGDLAVHGVDPVFRDDGGFCPE